MDTDAGVAVLLRLDEKLGRLVEQVAPLAEAVRVNAERLEVLERVVILGNGQPSLSIRVPSAEARVTAMELDHSGLAEMVDGLHEQVTALEARASAERNYRTKIFGASAAVAILGILGFLFEDSLAIGQLAELLKAVFGG